MSPADAPSSGKLLPRMMHMMGVHAGVACDVPVGLPTLGLVKDESLYQACSGQQACTA